MPPPLVIPAINAESWDEVIRRLRIVEPFVDWVHIDVANGTMTPNILWHNPLDLVNLDTNCHIEIHLMEEEPEAHIKAWLTKAISRIIVHYEATHDLDHVIRECKADGVEIGLAIAPETTWTLLKPFVMQVDLLQILAVHPGSSNQKFERHCLSKVKHLRTGYPPAKIEVDGGIDPEIARECVKAGADILASGHYIFTHPSPKMALEELRGA